MYKPSVAGVWATAFSYEKGSARLVTRARGAHATTKLSPAAILQAHFVLRERLNALGGPFASRRRFGSTRARISRAATAGGAAEQWVRQPATALGNRFRLTTRRRC